MVRDDNGTYYLQSTVENFRTAKFDPNQTRYSDTDDFFDGTADPYQKDAVDAHENVQCVMKYFKNTFGRNGNDGNGSLYKVFIEESNQLYNAYGEENQVSFFGGHVYVYDQINQIILRSERSISCALDVVGHEYTHGILFSEGLQYDTYQECGALHEGLGDVFGTLCEKFITTDVVNNTNTFDWTFAEDGGFIPGYIKRDCAFPNINNYSQYINGTTESHDGGGIISKAAYLIAEGGTHNNKTVAAIDADDQTAYTKLGDIFYDAVNNGYIVPNMTFAQFALAAVHAAGLAYPNGLEKETVIDAFIAVGILNDVPTSFHLSQRSGLSVQFSWLCDAYETNYAIYRKVTGSADAPVRVSEISTNRIVSVNTLPGSYDFYVARVDYAGNRTSDFSNVVTVESYMGAPANFRITNRSGLLVQFSWDGTSGTRYALYRQPEGSADPLEKCAETTDPTVSVNTLSGNYNYYVAQLDENGNRVSYLSDPVLVETSYPALQNFRITNRSGLQIEFTWDGADNPGARYAIYRRPTGSVDPLEKCLETTNTSATVNTLIGSYDYFVAQENENGDIISFLSDSVPVVA